MSGQAARGPPELGEVRQLAPRSRQERMGEVHKEDLEKMRLRARRECYYHHEEAAIEQPPESLGYIRESERFITDIAAVEKDERNAAVARRELMFHNKRQQRTADEERRWKAIESGYDADSAHQAQMQADGTFSKSNRTSMPYDPISLKYGEGKDGECLKYSDEALRYRSALRADHLQQRTNSGFNPITGEATARVPVPERPTPPDFIKRGGH